MRLRFIFGSSLSGADSMLSDLSAGLPPAVSGGRVQQLWPPASGICELPRSRCGCVALRGGGFDLLPPARLEGDPCGEGRAGVFASSPAGFEKMPPVCRRPGRCGSFPCRRPRGRSDCALCMAAADGRWLPGPGPCSCRPAFCGPGAALIVQGAVKRLPAQWDPRGRAPAPALLLVPGAQFGVFYCRIQNV